MVNHEGTKTIVVNSPGSVLFFTETSGDTQQQHIRDGTLDYQTPLSRELSPTTPLEISCSSLSPYSARNVNSASSSPVTKIAYFKQDSTIMPGGHIKKQESLKYTNLVLSNHTEKKFLAYMYDSRKEENCLNNTLITFSEPEHDSVLQHSNTKFLSPLEVMDHENTQKMELKCNIELLSDNKLQAEGQQCKGLDDTKQNTELDVNKIHSLTETIKKLEEVDRQRLLAMSMLEAELRSTKDSLQQAEQDTLTLEGAKRAYEAIFVNLQDNNGFFTNAGDKSGPFETINKVRYDNERFAAQIIEKERDLKATQEILAAKEAEVGKLKLLLEETKVVNEILGLDQEQTQNANNEEIKTVQKREVIKKTNEYKNKEAKK